MSGPCNTCDLFRKGACHNVCNMAMADIRGKYRNNPYPAPQAFLHTKERQYANYAERFWPDRKNAEDHYTTTGERY